MGGRSAAQGYASGDAVRQQLTKKRDIETGMDYFGVRFYSSAAGIEIDTISSSDPLMASGS